MHVFLQYSSFKLISFSFIHAFSVRLPNHHNIFVAKDVSSTSVESHHSIYYVHTLINLLQLNPDSLLK